jgi:hypothetical protein
VSSGDFINENLRRFGGILFRNFPVMGLAEFEKFARTVSEGDLLEYRERSSPRSHVGGNSLYLNRLPGGPKHLCP